MGKRKKRHYRTKIKGELKLDNTAEVINKCKKEDKRECESYLQKL
jgi:hypothetical protein